MIRSRCRFDISVQHPFGRRVWSAGKSTRIFIIFQSVPPCHPKLQNASLPHWQKLYPTQNVSLGLVANLQIARARFALGYKEAASELLKDVISESQQRGYELHGLGVKP
jgi:hypothetical protein